MITRLRISARLIGVTVLLAFGWLQAFGQGDVWFANFGTQGPEVIIDAPVFAEDGVTRLAGAGFRAMLYARPVGSSDPYIAQGAAEPFVDLLSGGYWRPATRTITMAWEVEVVVRVWRVADGTTWEDAFAAGRGYGETAPFTIIPRGGTAPPALMFGLSSTQLVPEPSTMALMLPALFALLAMSGRWCKGLRT